MSKRLARFTAILLIVLGVSPFTAPFATCDLGTLTGTGPSDIHRPADYQSTHNAVVKWSAPDKAPMLAEAAPSTTPLLVTTPSEATACHGRVSARQPARQILRI